MSTRSTKSSASASTFGPGHPNGAGRDLSKHERLVEWIVHENGFLHPDVRLVHAPSRGFHMVVKPGRSIGPQTRVVSCPTSCVMSVLNTLDIDDQFTCRGVRFPNSFLQSNHSAPDVLHTFYLMEHYLRGDKSWWYPYISTLPQLEDVKEFFFDDPDDKLWITGTNLDFAYTKQQEWWRQTYVSGLKQLETLGWKNAVNGLDTWELFRWAATIYRTRAFTSQVLSDTRAADRARLGFGGRGNEDQILSKLFSDSFPVLLPLLDLCSHKPGAQVEWQTRYSFVGLQLLESFAENQEIFNNYGPRDNESLLLGYGFAVEDNPFDHVAISLKVPPGSFLETVRTWPQDSKSDVNRACYLFKAGHPRVQSALSFETSVFSYDLLDSLSVLTGNDREVQAMFQGQRTLFSTALSSNGKFQDLHNLLCVLSQLLLDCTARLVKLRSTDPVGMNPPRTPRCVKHRYAQIYRVSQAAILETAIAVSVFVLIRASTTRKDNEIMIGLRNLCTTMCGLTLSEQVLKDVDSVRDKLPVLSRSEELFTVEGLLAMLPVLTSGSLRKCFAEIEDNWRQAMNHGTIQTPLDIVTQTKSRLAIFLSAIYVESTRGTRLPQRLKSWLNELTSWYPPKDPNWSYVPNPGPWAPGEEPPQELMALLAARASMSPQWSAESNIKQWLTPEMICWGWNVMFEEKVQVPIGLENVVAGDSEKTGEHGEVTVMLYCRQY